MTTLVQVLGFILILSFTVAALARALSPRDSIPSAAGMSTVTPDQSPRWLVHLAGAYTPEDGQSCIVCGVKLVEGCDTTEKEWMVRTGNQYFPHIREFPTGKLVAVLNSKRVNYSQVMDEEDLNSEMKKCEITL